MSGLVFAKFLLFKNRRVYFRGPMTNIT